MHATNVLRATGAVVPAEDYRAVVAERDQLARRVADLTAVLEAMTPPRLRFGAYTVDLRSGAIRRDGLWLATFTPTERAILRRLAVNAPHAVSYGELCADVWPGVSAGSDLLRVVRVNLSRMRQRFDNAVGAYLFDEYVRVSIGFGIAVQPSPEAPT